MQLRVLEVNGYAFYDNDNITSLKICNPGNIGISAFFDCDALIDANILNQGSIGNGAFCNCNSLNNIFIGNKVTKLDYECFKDCTSLIKIIIPNEISSLGSSVFYGCTSLKEIQIGYGIKTIPGYTFYNCSSLSNIIIPANVNKIDDCVFYGCTSLSDVTIDKPQNEAQYFEDWSGHPNESKEYEINIKAGDILSFTLVSRETWSNSEYAIRAYIDGKLVAYSYYNYSETYFKSYSVDTKITLKISNGSNNYGEINNLGLNIASLPLALGSNYRNPLFANCPLDEVYIGRKLSYSTSSSYGYSPFYRNTSLRSVKITDAETEIYDNEFYGCSNLQEFECGDGVETIGNWAFSGCSSLKSYSSGTNVKTIGQEAFSDCTAMTSFTTLAAEPPVCGDQALDDINKWECTLHVPAESIDEYQAADQWKEFFFIEASGVEDVTVDEDDADVAPVYYNLQGVRVDNPSAGIYIVRRGNKTTKEYVN